jgi:hypothetical protein
MCRGRSRALALVVTTAMAIAGPAMAARLRTPAIMPGSDQILVCEVVNLAGDRLAITAELVDRRGENVTGFVRTEWDATEQILLMVHAEATNPDARYCRVTVRGGRKANVAVSLQACTFDLSVCGDPVVGHRRTGRSGADVLRTPSMPDWPLADRRQGQNWK